MTATDRDEVRAAYYIGHEVVELAADYGVTEAVIRTIVRRAQPTTLPLGRQCTS